MDRETWETIGRFDSEWVFLRDSLASFPLSGMMECRFVRLYITDVHREYCHRVVLSHLQYADIPFCLPS
jgi:hypothetical protein